MKHRRSCWTAAVIASGLYLFRSVCFCVKMRNGHIIAVNFKVQEVNPDESRNLPRQIYEKIRGIEVVLLHCQLTFIGNYNGGMIAAKYDALRINIAEVVILLISAVKKLYNKFYLKISSRYAAYYYTTEQP